MPAAPSPLDLRLAQLLIARGAPPERVSALHAQGTARRLEHRGSVLLGAALAAGQLTLEQASELLAAAAGADGIEAPAPEEVPPLERAVGQVLVHRGLVTPVRLAELFGQARARGRRHGGSWLAAEAIAQGLLTPATADLLLRTLDPAGSPSGSPASGASAADADALIAKALGGRALPDANPRDADGLIQRALEEAVPRAGPNAPRQPVRLNAPRPAPAPAQPAPAPAALGPSLPGGFGMGPAGFGMSPGGSPTGPQGDATRREPPPGDATALEPPSGDATVLEPPSGEATVLEPPPGQATFMGPSLGPTRMGAPAAGATFMGPGSDQGATLGGDAPGTLAGLPPRSDATQWTDARQSPDATQWPQGPQAGQGPDARQGPLATQGPDARQAPDATQWEPAPELPPADANATRWDKGPSASASGVPPSGVSDPQSTRWEAGPAATSRQGPPAPPGAPVYPAMGAPATASPATASPATEAGKPAPAAVRRGRVSATARHGSSRSFLEEVFAGERYQALPGAPTAGAQPALDRRLRREVVLRTPSAPIRGAGEAERFLREAHLLAQLDHPGIPRVHDIGLRDGQPYYATDPLPGERLSERADAGALPRLNALLRAFLRVAAAIEHAHQAGLVHGELGPERVVLGERGQVWVDGWARATALPGAAESIAAAARAAWPEGEPPPHQAPEARSGRPLGARADVWGLGVVLLWIVARRLPGPRTDPLRGASGDAPRELLAIVRRALAHAPSGRYPSARALLEDVRAYLDGGAVSAAPETLWDTTRRLARRHPLPAAIAAGGLTLLGLIGGLALRSVHADWRRAQASVATAQLELRRAVELRELASVRLEAARRRSQGEAELSRARAETHEPAALARFAAAEEAARQAQAKDEEAAALAARLDEERGPEPPRSHSAAQELAARARRLRGEWALRVAGGGTALPPLERALADWKALCERDPRDPEAQLGRYQAARRLPGAPASREEEAALAALIELEGPLADLARAELALREAEAGAARGRDPRAGADQALGLAEGAIADRPDLALGFEVRGRARLLRSGRGHVSQRHDPKLIEPGLGDLLHAARLDPRDPFPRLALLRHWNEAYGSHQPWRYEVREWVGELERAGALTARVEPALELATYLQDQDLATSSLPVLERTLARLAPDPRPGEELQRARLRVLHLRAALAAGLPAGQAARALPAELPPGLLAQGAMLRAHRALIEERGEPAAQALNEAMRALNLSRDPEANQDFLRLLADERTDARLALQVMGGGLTLPPPGDPAAGGMAPLVAAILHAGARAGVPLQQLDRFARWLAGVGALIWDHPRLDVFTPARLGHARILLQVDPRAPDAGFWPLVVWAGANHMFGSAPARASEAQALLAERARRLGRPELARAFETREPARTAQDEVWVRRMWEPAPEAQR